MRTSSTTILPWIARLLLLHGTAMAFVAGPPSPSPFASQIGSTTHSYRRISMAARHDQVVEASKNNNHQKRQLSTQYTTRRDESPKFSMDVSWPTKITSMTCKTIAALMVLSSCWFASPIMASAETTKPEEILSCLLQKCPKSLTSCVLNPKCLANVICLNTCGDNIDCQIKCGDYFDNPVVGEFNKCVVSDMSCVKQKPDDGSYPLPDQGVTVPKFDTSFFNGRLYIAAGQNPLFDIFPCQVHFFTETEPGKFFGKLNWRVTEPDGEFFTKDALQEFVQDPKDPAHLINHDNEYLHYKDDWYIVDYDDGLVDPANKFAFVYYRGSNDAWDGYGGVVVYTATPTLPDAIRPRLIKAAQAIHYDFDKDFTVTDNSCPAELSAGEKVLLREKFIADKVFLQTESQLQSASVRLRGNAVNSIKAQKLFFENRFPVAQKAFDTLDQSQQDFERESTK